MENQTQQENKELKALPTKVFLVTGGSGFLGRFIVDSLLEANTFSHVRIIDRADPDGMHSTSGSSLGVSHTGHNSSTDQLSERVEYFIGDIRDKQSVREACKGVDCVFHCAALTSATANYSDYEEVNVTGTRNVIECCVECGVSQLIYTSTASVVMDGNDIKNGDENSLPYPKRYLDDYSATKAAGERLVIAANGTRLLIANSRDGAQLLSTCSLRPHCMFGPRDTHFLPKIIQRARGGEITHMVGDGRNVVDFTYVGNVAHAHLLAAKHLSAQSSVAGQCYFITNGQPRPFWDFVGIILAETGCIGPQKRIPFSVAYFFACLMEILRKLMGRFYFFHAPITRHTVCMMACHHWFNHAKATRDLGYKPITSMDRALDITVEYFQQNLPSSSLSSSALTSLTSRSFSSSFGQVPRSILHESLNPSSNSSSSATRSDTDAQRLNSSKK